MCYDIVAIALPILFIACGGILKCIAAHETRVRSFYLGLDLALASLTVAVLSAVQPPALPKEAVHADTQFGSFSPTGIAVLYAFFATVFTLWGQMEYEKWRAGHGIPTKKEQLLMLLGHNMLGAVGIILSAFALR